jgi:hypothetical protein
MARRQRCRIRVVNVSQGRFRCVVVMWHGVSSSPRGCRVLNARSVQPRKKKYSVFTNVSESLLPYHRVSSDHSVRDYYSIIMAATRWQTARRTEPLLIQNSERAGFCKPAIRLLSDSASSSGRLRLFETTSQGRREFVYMPGDAGQVAAGHDLRIHIGSGVAPSTTAIAVEFSR